MLALLRIAAARIGQTPLPHFIDLPLWVKSIFGFAVSTSGIWIFKRHMTISLKTVFDPSWRCVAALEGRVFGATLATHRL